MFRLTFVLVFLLLTLPYSVHASDSSYITSGTIRARALAMGSAYFSVEDDFSSGLYNPGTFRVNATRAERPFRLFFNPVLIGTGLYDLSEYDLDFKKDDELTTEEMLLTAATMLKGAVYSTPFLDMGVALWEEVITTEADGAANRHFFSIENLAKNSFHSAFMNIKIASSVSIGVAGTLYNQRENGKYKFMSGHTFGVMLNPNPKLKVGITYNFFPEDFYGARFGLESLENETVTGGISYYPDKNTVLSIDLRNLNKEDKSTSREIHAGFEKQFAGILALRAGYYRKKTTQNDVLSFGVGLLPKWEKISKFATSSRNDRLSYTVIFEEDGFKRSWHVFSLLLRY
ncbi:hypothetical protein LLG96_15405 [bacterium]|nr:hypothetical protein [bacterium]